MKTFKKILSVVLAVIMIVGVLPFVYRLDKDLAASETVLEENLTNGFVQGPKDAVIFMTSATSQYFYYYDAVFGKNFADNLVGGVGVHDGSDYTDTPFERLIFVFTNQHDWGDVAAAIRLTGFAKDAEVIWTSKCTVQYPKNVWTFNYNGGKGDKADSVSLAVDPTAQAKTYDHYTDNSGGLKIWQRSGSVAQLENRSTRLGCNMTWDYINVSTQGTQSGKFPAIDANGYDFKVGENVNFTYGSEEGNVARFVLYNNAFNSDVQNIEILSGEWIGLLAFPAEQDCTQTLAGTLNVTLGPKVTIIGANTTFGGMIRNLSVFANANMAETAVINYNINGTAFSEFENSFVLGGHRCSSSDIHATGATTTVAGTINININGYDEENPFPLNLAAQGLPSSYHNNIKVNTECGTGLTVNATLSSGFAIAEDKRITINSTAFNAGNAEYITSNAYLDVELGEALTANYINSLNALICDHKFTATAGMVDEEYKVSLSCNNEGCGLVREFDADRNGHPVIYVDGLTGSDEYFGNTPANAVQSMNRASALLAKWNVGGTIVVVDGHNNREYASGFEPINTAGGTITITSSTNDFITARIRGDFRETAGACWVPYINIWTYEDVVLENLDIVSNMNTKAFYLNGNNLAIKESCNFRDYTAAALAGVGKRMELAEGVSSSATLAIVTGHNPSDGHIDTYPDNIGTQNIVLEKGNFGAIVFGNSMANLTYEETLKPLSGNVNVYVGEQAIVTNIDAKPEISTALNPTFIFENRTDYTISGADTTNAGVNIKAAEAVVNAPADHVVLVNNENLTFVQNSVKWAEGVASVRVENVVNAVWMDANVAELGFFIKEYDNAPFATYFAHAELENYVSEGIGKSLAYENTENGAKNYYWNGEDENVTFRGVLTFDTVDGETILNADKEFVAVPYALLTSGEFVNGASVVFTLREVCEAILADENASENDKAKAQAIIDAIPAEKQLPEINESEGVGEPVTPDPDEPVTEPTTEPIVVNVNSVVAERGETVTFTATLSGAVKNVGSIAVDVQFDEDVLEYANGDTSGEWIFVVLDEYGDTVDADLKNFISAKNKGAIAYADAFEVSGDLFSVTFKVKDGAPIGTTDVKLNIYCKSNDYKDIEISNIGGTITVAGDTET